MKLKPFLNCIYSISLEKKKHSQYLRGCSLCTWQGSCFYFESCVATTEGHLGNEVFKKKKKMYCGSCKRLQSCITPMWPRRGRVELQTAANTPHIKYCCMHSFVLTNVMFLLCYHYILFNWNIQIEFQNLSETRKPVGTWVYSIFWRQCKLQYLQFRVWRLLLRALTIQPLLTSLLPIWALHLKTKLID